jgi:metallophosphoesterase superfamily enzyme
MWYREADIAVSNEKLLIKNFLFVHDVLKKDIKAGKGQYIFSGHLHPGITLKGRGKQSLRFPCFYFAKKFCVLPAFSHFTGTYKVEPQENEKAYAIVEKDIIPLK